MVHRKRISIKDVAKKAGVSTATVSRVINDHPDVSQETRERVARVINGLGYQPSVLAQPDPGSSRTVGVVGSGMKYFGLPASYQRSKNLSVLGYSLLLTLTRQPETNDVEGILHDMLSRHVDGIVWAVPEIGNNQDWVERLLPNSRANRFLQRSAASWTFGCRV